MYILSFWSCIAFCHSSDDLQPAAPLGRYAMQREEERKKGWDLIGYNCGHAFGQRQMFREVFGKVVKMMTRLVIMRSETVQKQ